jgi:hypothetical protein
MARRVAAIALPILASLLLAAHFFRASLYPLVAACLAMIVLPFVARRWAGRVLQASLAVGAIEWLRTAWMLAAERASFGEPYGRLLAILGSVAALTLAAALAVRVRGEAPRERGAP